MQYKSRPYLSLQPFLVSCKAAPAAQLPTTFDLQGTFCSDSVDGAAAPQTVNTPADDCAEQCSGLSKELGQTTTQRCLKME
jgi:hypothetical protein